MGFRDVEKFFIWDSSAKRYRIQAWRREILPSWMYFTENDLVGDKIILGAATAPPVHYTQPYYSMEGADGNLGTPFLARGIVFEDSVDGTAVADFAVTIKETGEARTFMNNPIHIRCLAGTARRPAILREPLLISSKHVLQVDVRKFSVGDTAMRMYLIGAQYYPWAPEFLRRPEASRIIRETIRKWNERRKYVVPYWFTTEVVPVPILGGATVDVIAKVGDDGPLEIFGITSVSTGNYQLAVREMRKFQTIMNGTVTVANGLGTNLYPMAFSTPWLIPEGTRVQCRITDLSGAPNNVYLCFFGRKIYAPFRDVKDVLNETEVPTMADEPTPMVPAPLG